MPVLAVAVALSAALSGAPADTVSIATLKAEYASIIELQDRAVGRDTFTSVSLRPDASSATYLGSFVEAYAYPLVYLITYGPGFDQTPMLTADRPIEARATEYFAALREDDQFNDALLPMVARHLAGKGISVAGLRIDAQESESFERLRTFAVRFFYPDAVGPDGRVTGHVCASINGLRDIEGGRDLELEALAYASIVRNISTAPRPNLATEFGGVLRSLSELSLSMLPEMKVIRAQGAMWSAMAQSAQLEAVLRQGYEDWGSILGYDLS